LIPVSVFGKNSAKTFYHNIATSYYTCVVIRGRIFFAKKLEEMRLPRK
jgi:hypothetical protein